MLLWWLRDDRYNQAFHHSKHRRITHKHTMSFFFFLSKISLCRFKHFSTSRCIPQSNLFFKSKVSTLIQDSMYYLYSAYICLIISELVSCNLLTFLQNKCARLSKPHLTTKTLHHDPWLSLRRLKSAHKMQNALMRHLFCIKQLKTRNTTGS